MHTDHVGRRGCHFLNCGVVLGDTLRILDVEKSETAVGEHGAPIPTVEL